MARMNTETKHSLLWKEPKKTWHCRATKLLIPIVVSISSVGCAHRSLYFGTKTEIGVGITGTTTAPTSLNLGYDRSEVALIPSKTNGETHSVYGGLDYDLGPLLGGSTILTQTFATGNAARVAVGDKSVTDSGTNQQGRLFFATGTKIALNIDFGQSLGQSVPSFLFGFRRSEGTVVPIRDPNAEVNAVYADLSLVIDRNGAVRATTLNNGTDDITYLRDPVARDKLPHTLHGIRIIQRFATGNAAVRVAGDPVIKAKLDAAAGKTMATGLDLTAAIQMMDQRLRGVTTHAIQAAIISDMKASGALSANHTWSDLQRDLAALMSVNAYRAALEQSMDQHAPLP